jgi:predicted dehydrogenase
MMLFQGCRDVEMVCAYDPDAELLRSFCAEFGLKGYTDIDRMLAEQELNLAVIFLPHSDCAEAAIKCARRGLHLMIEKPVSNTVGGVQQIAAVAAECRVKLTTGYCWRYHPVVKAMKEIVAQGLIGKLVSVEARLSAGRVDRYIAGHSAWMLKKEKSGGGPMYNLGVHWLDMIRYVTEETVAEVCAVNISTSNVYDIEDSSLVLMKFASGAAGVLTTSYIVPESYPCGRDLYVGLRGTSGVLSYCPHYEGEQGGGGVPNTDVLELYSSSPQMAGSAVRQYCFQLDQVAGYSGYMGKAYVERFLDAIRQDRAPDITAEAALSVLQTVDAIYESAEKKQWIKVC